MNNRRISLINPRTIRPSQLFDSFFDEFFNVDPLSTLEKEKNGLNTLVTDSIEVDMYETDKEVIVEAKVPGFKEENLNIKVEGNILTIEGSKQEESESKDERKYHIKEVKSSSVFRSIMLPTKVDANSSEAEFKDGIVKIVLPKLGENSSTSIKIKTKSGK